MDKNNGISEEEFMNVANTILSLKTTINLLSKQIKTLEKNVNKKVGKLEKKANKKKVNKKKKKSGFASPQIISEELRTFMGLEPDKMVPRTEVTQYINNYIKTNDLQDSTKKQQINPDDTLSALLKINKGETLTYFNIQKYMNQHFK
tara:strand:- start:42 stop:482 length:441 start_codon:yes stop_codon:yes gene_type:complete